jgi:hypothetical protein
MKKNYLMITVILSTIFNLNVFAQTNETEIVIGDEWSILEGENQGNPMFIRKTTGATYVNIEVTKFFVL